MIGARVGIRVGMRVGVAVGSSEDQLDGSAGSGGIAGVTRDSTSGKYLPANAAEWTLLMAAAGLATGNPSSCYNIGSVASGNLPDSIGTLTMSTSGAGSAYQQAESGWSTPAIVMTEGSIANFQTTSASLPDILTNSCALLVYARIANSGITRSVAGMGLAPTRCAAERVLTTGRAMCVCNGQSQQSVADMTGVVRPWLIQINRTAGSAALSLDAENVVPTFGVTAAGKAITLGVLQTNAPGGAFLYAARFDNAAAEWTLAQRRTLLTTLGWSVLW